jgi:hypothetical protein
VARKYFFARAHPSAVCQHAFPPGRRLSCVGEMSETALGATPHAPPARASKGRLIR